jgi:hypothetical protein
MKLISHFFRTLHPAFRAILYLRGQFRHAQEIAQHRSEKSHIELRPNSPQFASLIPTHFFLLRS